MYTIKFKNVNYSIQRLQQQLTSVVRLTLFSKFLKILREDAPFHTSDNTSDCF